MERGLAPPLRLPPPARDEEKPPRSEHSEEESELESQEPPGEPPQTCRVVRFGIRVGRKGCGGGRKVSFGLLAADPPPAAASASGPAGPPAAASAEGQVPRRPPKGPPEEPARIAGAAWVKVVKVSVAEA
mmetsp:Transcript_1822/g.4644  ORF Transcript_1822/g.4644 Transcript_1822/m.4644 type:complete len:130 (+) Transcript_1822:811-1200(+)